MGGHISQNNLEKIISNMPTRLEEIIRQKGQPTKY